VSWLIDPSTGDYRHDDDGAFIRDSGLQTAVYMLLTTERGSSIDDPTFGSRIHTLRRHKSPARAALELPDMVAEAMAPALEDGRVSRVTTEASVRDRHTVEAVITVYDSGDTPYQFTLYQPVGT